MMLQKFSVRCWNSRKDTDKEGDFVLSIKNVICRAISLIPWRRSPEAFRQVNTERMRHRRELARSEGQAGHNLTVQTTIDMARTQTWTGGG